MRCVKCNSNTSIIDSRKYHDSDKDFDFVNRQRLCKPCNHKFLTIEVSEETWVNVLNQKIKVVDEQ